MISGKNAAWEATGGVNEANIWPKIAEICYILIQKHNQTQTQLHLVSLENSSTLTISDPFVAHSCFHPIDSKNGLKLFFLLSLCFFSAAFAVGEDEHILAFNFDW